MGVLANSTGSWPRKECSARGVMQDKINSTGFLSPAPSKLRLTALASRSHFFAAPDPNAAGASIRGAAYLYRLDFANWLPTPQASSA